MASPLSFSDRAKHLCMSPQLPLGTSSSLPQDEIIRRRRKISALANEILHTAPPDSSDAKEALSLIARVTPNTFPRDLKFGLFINLRDRVADPAAQSRPYPATLQTPFIAKYTTAGGPYKMLARLDGAAIWDQIPAEILRCLGSGLDPAQVDVFLVQNNSGYGGYEIVQGDYSGGHYDTLQYELLLKFHQWAFPDLPPGSDHPKKLYMGAFPDFGIYRAQHWPAPVGYMENMDIHAHPDRGGRDMLYSPNGAHIAIDTDSPFASLWMVAREGSRACIAKVLLSLYKPGQSRVDGDKTHPLFNAYFALSANCRSLEEYATKLIQFAPLIQGYADKTWLPYLTAMTSPDLAGADRIFQTLPRTFQSAFLKQLWILKGRPKGHDDFGKLCYEESGSLPPELRATPTDRIAASEAVKAEMFRVLVTEPLELLELKIPERRDEAGRAAHPPVIEHPLQGGSGDSSLSRAAAPAPPSTSDVNILIRECLHSLRESRERGVPKAELVRILDQLNHFAAGRIPADQKASDRLFTLVYECHNMAMEEFELQKPDHPEFGRAAFFSEEKAITHPNVIDMALDVLQEELLPRA